MPTIADVKIGSNLKWMSEDQLLTQTEFVDAAGIALN